MKKGLEKFMPDDDIENVSPQDIDGVAELGDER